LQPGNFQAFLDCLFPNDPAIRSRFFAILLSDFQAFLDCLFPNDPAKRSRLFAKFVEAPRSAELVAELLELINRGIQEALIFCAFITAASVKIIDW
jgi:hypothetical protein